MPFEKLNFCYPWRAYQNRVLQAIDEHLEDDKLHIVAAPGAGKTTLGLEVFRRLKKRTLVLSPTRVIRDQWILRLKDFCQEEDVESLDWVSTDIDQPKILTSITYQALHAKLASQLNDENDRDADDGFDDSLGEGLDDRLDDGLDDEIDEALNDTEINRFIAHLSTHKIEVIIMDEAHHLRAEWWRAIDKVISVLTDITLVSLTATPPYDSQGHEWRRYEQLCGPIDEEISVPELVKAGTLCAHQDFIWAVNASQSDRQKIREYDQSVSVLCHELFESQPFSELVLAHPWLHANLVEDELESEAIKQPRIAIALLVFIKAQSLPIPASLVAILDLSEEDIPELGRHWWQVLLEAVLFSSSFTHSEAAKDFVSHLKKQLRASELLRKRELSLERSRRIDRSLSLSAAKIAGCVAIHKLEYKQRQEGLCQVILIDYIRDESLTSELEIGEINLGAWPVYKALVTQSEIAEQVGLLSGRLSMIHKDRLQALMSYVDPNRVTADKFKGDDYFYKVSGPLNQLTSAFTQLLMNRSLKVLVGTRSLLGEGWDAPAINSLILASTVGSFMLTNQMRGRAIRIDKNTPEKVSSIWHLVAIDTESPSGQRDYYDLKNRFETFVGLAEKSPTIESGFARLETSGLALLKSSQQANRAVSSNNWQMMRRYRQRASLAQRWQKALTLDESARIVPSVKTPTIPGIRWYHFKNTFKYLLLQLTVLFGIIGTSTLHFIRKPGVALVVLLGGLIGVMLYKLPKTIWIVRIFFSHLPVDGALKQIGIALCSALCQTGMIETSFRRIRVNSHECSDGTFYLAITGCTFYESSLFADCLAEILAPIDSPRYLVIREGEVYGLKRDDYHAVPLKLAVKKEFAQIFYKAWCRFVGPTEMIYTRTPEGRKRLLKAKMRAFSSVFESQVKRQDRWQ